MPAHLPLPGGPLPGGAGWALVRAGYRRYASYRAATLAGAFTNGVFGIIRVSILFAAAGAAGGVIAGYDRAALSTYVWLGQGMIASTAAFGWTELADRVRTGDIVVDLGRPVHPVLGWLAEDLGRAGQACLVRLLLPLTLGGLLFGLRAPTRPETVPLFAVSAVVAVVVSFGCRLLVNLTAFWLLDVRGVHTLYVVASTVLSGLVVPVAFFPGPLRTLAGLTPFPAILQIPTDLAVERATGAAALGALAGQLAWAGALLALGVLMLRRAIRRLVVQGG